MGGRGSVRFATQWSQKQLNARVQALSSQIATIDREANRIFQETYDAELADNLRRSYYTEAEAKRWARSTANADKLEYIEGTNRAELARERSKLRKELDAISAGQKTLFG